MSQGCHLPYSFEDQEHFNTETTPERSTGLIRDSFDILAGVPILSNKEIVHFDEKGRLFLDHTNAYLHRVPNFCLENFEKIMQEYPIKDRKILGDLLAKYPDMQYHIITGFGNPALDKEMVRELPQALAKIYAHTPDTMGIFNQARARASAWIKTLKNTSDKKLANGYANEILTTAKLMSVTAKSTSGKKFKIEPTDRIDFGLKEQASYGVLGPLQVTDGIDQETFFQPRSYTIEADMALTRPDGFLGYDTIIFDFKYSSTGASSHITQRQLDGITVSLQTNPNYDFYFFTNTQFDNKTKELVNAANQRIAEINRTGKQRNPDDWVGIRHIELFEHYNWKI